MLLQYRKLNPDYLSLFNLKINFNGLTFSRLRRPVGRMTVEEQHLEGEYRYVNSRLLTNG